jgi:hypothetical protein
MDASGPAAGRPAWPVRLFRMTLNAIFAFVILGVAIYVLARSILA